MKLKLNSARSGIQWVRLGIQTFFRQPLAMAGLFFMFMALMALLSRLPVIGVALAMTLLPAATLGLMAASREADQGRFPMPVLLLVAFRSGRQQTLAMLQLGALYATGFMLVMGLSWWVDDGGFARMYLGADPVGAEQAGSAEFQSAMWVFATLHLPLSLMFWHAPALVHWHGVTPLKSLFFSLVACWKNIGAFIVFGLAWVGLMVLVVSLISLIGVALGNPQVLGNLLFPAIMLIAAMFFSSIYFTFRDSFDTDKGDSA